MNAAAVIERSPVLRYLLRAQHIPLIFSVTIVSGILYHYAPEYTWLWILLSVGIQWVLFRLFDYVKKHPVIGGAAYLATGIAFLMVAFIFMSLGRETPPFAPEDPYLQLDFMVWFLTPQSVLTVKFPGYTIALFVLFTMFIATTAYYFTLVRYRVLMSFVVMVFPFAIYAKENEDMPVPMIIILLVCYFSVMIYCRQAHAESSDVYQRYAPDAVSHLKAPPKNSPYAKVTPEIMDGRFFQSIGIFIAAATILVLVVPKPEVEADRTVFDTMIDLSSLSDYLENAIRGFTDSSDSSDNFNTGYSRTLYYATGDEPLNLRMRTFTNYHYDKDEWTAAAYDKMPEQSDPEYVEQDGFYTLASQTDPQELENLLRKAAQAHPDFAEEYGLTEFAAEPVVPQDYYRYLRVMSATFNYFTFPSPIYLQRAKLLDGSVRPPMFYHSGNSILFRYQQARTFQQEYEMDYLSPDYFGSKNAQMLIHAVDPDEWLNLLTDAAIYYSEGEDSVMLRSALDEALNAVYLDHTVESETPDSIKQLAEQLTAGIDNPYDKAMAISDHLKYSGQYIYSLEYQFAEDDNLETFLFRNKTGVCRQYAGAMVELCRAAGLTARYVEGYSMVDKDTRPFVGAENVYVITTEHGHAFVDVYIPGAGWVQFNPTASADIVPSTRGARLTKALQFSGLILFGAALLFIALTVWIIPMIGEFLFRRKFRKNMDAAAVQAAFARLRKQWKADPAETARDLCAKQEQFLGVGLQALCSGFEETVYADKCSRETAERVYAEYCAAHDAYKPAVRRKRKLDRAARKAEAAAAET